jgi:photosystem II stability/assembly factor-like uncharacterized protein
MQKILLLIIIFMINNIPSEAQNKKSTANNTPLKSAALSKIAARHIGPAAMSGRVTAIAGVNKDPRIMYVGAAGGGVWKTTTGGSRFKPVFDKYCQSIGDIAIDQQNPETVWVGTGESNMRNTTSVGTGLYKTTDGGEFWTRVGLENTEHIAKIAIHPTNSNIVLVAAPGHLWDANEERGLFKTTDGGKTWKKTLYIDKNTGCADVLINPNNPNIVYATTWQFRRTPHSFDSGGKASALYKSTDGGDTWKKITNGLPTGDLGRIALALAPSAPDNMFAIVEAKETGLYMSTDGGETWKAQSATSNVTARPFYFSTLVVDPTDAKRVYRPALTFSISTDGGYSFAEPEYFGGGVHPDHHALWINPQNTSHLYLGTDGGVYVSFDKGNNWILLKNLPISQAYHVAVDNQQPYHVYTGFQDNGSWAAPSRKAGGIRNGDWKSLMGGDGFWVQPDLSNPDIVYAEYQGGNMSRINLKTNEQLDIQPYPAAGEAKLRWNWNTPIVKSPSNNNILYTGAQYLYKTENGGITWQKISGDLTTDDHKKQDQENSGGLTEDNTSAENHCTIFTIAESPLDANQIWVGTDDGNLQLTTNGGKTWTNLAANYAKCGIAAGTWVSSIEPSRFDKNTVYATFDNHAYGDCKTYVAKSTDLGKTWTLFSSPDFKSFAHKIKEDLQNKNLLFLGTEMGLFVSIDGGTNWTVMKGNIPEYAMVRDITIHPQTNDLVIATHGRGILIVDDITPLRKLSSDILNADVAFIETSPTPSTNGHYGWSWADAGEFVGRNPNENAQIMYYLKERVTKGDVKIEIYDTQGKFLYDMPGTKRKGINVVDWNMQMKPPKPVKGGSTLDNSGFYAPLLPPGKYKIKLKLNGKEYESYLTLIKDPLSAHNTTDQQLQQKTAMDAYNTTEDLAFLAAQIVDMREKIAQIQPQNNNEALQKQLQTYSDSLNNLRKNIMATKEGTNVGFSNDEKLRENLSKIYGAVVSYEGRPTDSHIARLNGLQVEIKDAQKRLADINNQNLPALNEALAKLSLPPLTTLSKEAFDAMKD